VLKCVTNCPRSSDLRQAHRFTTPPTNCSLRPALSLASVLQHVAECCSVLQCVAVCCSVLQCVAVCCSVLQCVAVFSLRDYVLLCVAVRCSVILCVVVCRNVLQCIAKCRNVLQCVAVCISLPILRHVLPCHLTFRIPRGPRVFSRIGGTKNMI